MSEEIKAALLREVHRLIAEAAEGGVARIVRDSVGTHAATVLDYPPSDGRGDDHVLTVSEAAALAKVVASDAARSGLRKLLREAASAPVFQLFCLLDGVADPDGWNGATWLGADLVPPQDAENREMLHDAFLESYWAFATQR